MAKSKNGDLGATPGLATFEGAYYPPDKWTCPVCNKEHTKPHFAHPGQIDYSKEPNEKGRVLFNREEFVGRYTCDTDYKGDTPERKEYIGKTGNAADLDGIPNPMFCPHCGYQGQNIILTKNISTKKVW